MKIAPFRHFILIRLFCSREKIPGSGHWGVIFYAKLSPPRKLRDKERARAKHVIKRRGFRSKGNCAFRRWESETLK